MRVNAHLSVQINPHHPGETNSCYSLDLVALQKNFMFMCSLFTVHCPQNGLAFTCWLVYQPWSVFASHLLLQKFLMPLIIVSAPKCFPDLPLTLFLYFNISFCWRTIAFYDWSNILFIWSLSFQIFDHYSLFKKKRAYWKKIKQLWFLKCTVVFSHICLVKYVSLPISTLQAWSWSGILRSNDGRSY